MSISHSRSPVLRAGAEQTGPTASGDNEKGTDNIEALSSAQVFHQSPSLVSDAIRRLSLAATDRDSVPRYSLASLSLPSSTFAPDSTFATARGVSGQDVYGTYNSGLLDSYPYPSQPQIQSSAQTQAQITRIMTNLLTFPRHRGRRHSNSFRSSVGLNSIWGADEGGKFGGEDENGMGTGSRSYATLAAPRRSEVVIANTTGLEGGDKSVAADYIFFAPGDSGEGDAGDLGVVCDWNVAVARAHGRYDHERIFRSLGAILGAAMVPGDEELGLRFRCLSLVKQLLDRL